MQYSKRVNDSNRRCAGTEKNSRMMLASRLMTVALIAVCGTAITGCSDSLSNAQTNQTFANSLKGYDKTMTPQQSQAAIADLQKEQAARAAASQAGSTGSVKPAQN